MRYYDQHLHTYFSPDSRETFENYLSQSDLPIISTEHLDFFSSLQKLDDVVPDYEGYSATVAQLNERYDHRLLKGIEVGFTFDDRCRIEEFLQGKQYDLKLLSIHHNGRHGFMTLNHQQKPIDLHLDEYFHLMLQAVEQAPYANVLAHFDFGLRGYDNVQLSDLERKEAVLTEIFRRMIQQDQALELNTRSMYRYGNAHLYDYAIALYKQLGGQLFTVSSDAHVAKDYQLNFKEAFEKLRQHDVKKLAIFQNDEAILVPIPEE